MGLILNLLLPLSLIIFVGLLFLYWKQKKDAESAKKLEEEKIQEEKKRNLPNFNLLNNEEVFHVGNNNFTFDQAKHVCRSMNSKLATYDQMVEAYQKGAEWCNYGWSENQMALFPTQRKTWEKLQKAPKKNRDDCGSPGINGGYFEDSSLKFGVNCYGVKKDEPTEMKAEIDDYISRKDKYEQELQAYYKNKNYDVVPFNRTNWNSQ